MTRREAGRSVARLRSQMPQQFGCILQPPDRRWPSGRLAELDNRLEFQPYHIRQNRRLLSGCSAFSPGGQIIFLLKR